MIATPCFLFIASKSISIHGKRIYTLMGVISWCRNPAQPFHKHLNIFFEDHVYLPTCIPNVLHISLSTAIPGLSWCVCCAVSVDLWYRSQGPPLKAHLYLSCRDTAHRDRMSEPGPCGHERTGREREKSTLYTAIKWASDRWNRKKK